MRVARVIGQVVSTAKADTIAGRTILLLGDVDPARPEATPTTAYAAIDLIGAGRGELVLVVNGSAARVGLADPTAPVDAAAIGIVDSLILEGAVTYEK